MSYVPAPVRVPKKDDDVAPATPFGPPYTPDTDWPTTPEITHGIGDIKDVTPGDVVFEEHEPLVHLHPGPLGFA